MGFFSVTRNYQSRASVTFHHTRSSNSNHATMPSVAIDHHAIRVSQSGIFRQPQLDGVDNPPLLVLTLAVQLVETRCNFASAHQLLHAEQFDHVTCNVHSSSRIDSGRDPERHFTRIQWLPTELCNFEQSFQSWVHRSAQGIQSETRNDSVFSYQRDRIRDGCNGRDFHEGEQQLRLVALRQSSLHKSLRNFEGNTRAAERLAWIFTSRLIWINNCESTGQTVRAGKMMVGNDEVHACAPRALCRGKGASARADADHESNARRGCALDYISAQVVAFTNTVRYVEIG